MEPPRRGHNLWGQQNGMRVGIVLLVVTLVLAFAFFLALMTAMPPQAGSVTNGFEAGAHTKPISIATTVHIAASKGKSKSKSAVHPITVHTSKSNSSL